MAFKLLASAFLTKAELLADQFTTALLHVLGECSYTSKPPKSQWGSRCCTS